MFIDMPKSLKPASSTTTIRMWGCCCPPRGSQLLEEYLGSLAGEKVGPGVDPVAGEPVDDTGMVREKNMAQTGDPGRNSTSTISRMGYECRSGPRQWCNALSNPAALDATPLERYN